MEEKFVGLIVDSVSEPILGKGGQSYVKVVVRYYVHNPFRPKLKRIGASNVDAVTLVLWLPGTEFPIPGSTRTLKPSNIFPADGLEKGDLLEGAVMMVACDPHSPYKWTAEDGSTIIQTEVKVAVMADPEHPLFRQFLVEAIAAKGIVPADEELKRSTRRIPAAIKVEGEDPKPLDTPPQNETPAQVTPAQVTPTLPVQDEVEVEGNTSDPF